VAALAAASYGAATLSVGLETLARGDVEQAVIALRTLPLARVHRVGWTIVVSLARLARSLGARRERADEADRTLLAALEAPRPRLADGRPISQVADVRRVTSSLAVIGAKVALVEALGDEGNASLGAVIRTAIVRATLGVPLTPVAVTLPDLQAFLRAPEKDVAPAFTALGKSLPEEFAAVISGYRRELQAELGALDSENPPDAHILGGFLVFA
jgi:hypothetical protein